MQELLGRPVPLVANWVDGVAVQPGELVLLENCRVNKGEKKNNEELSKKLAALCDIFVHDAFGTAHRAEATTYGIAQFAPSPAPARCWPPDRRHLQGPGQPQAPAGGHRRRLQGLDQADHPCKACPRTWTA